MDANNNLIEMVDDDQGEGIKDPIPDELAQKMQQLDKEKMLEELEEEQDPIPWLPDVGMKFILKFDDKHEREYKVTYINQGKYRFSSEPTDKSYLK